MCPDSVLVLNSVSSHCVLGLFFFFPCWLRLVLNFCLIYVLFRKMFVNRRKLFHFFLEIFRDSTTVLLAIFKVQWWTVFRNFPIFSLISPSLVASGKRVFPFQHLQSEICWTVLFFFLCSFFFFPFLIRKHPKLPSCLCGLQFSALQVCLLAGATSWECPWNQIVGNATWSILQKARCPIWHPVWMRKGLI